MYEIDLHGKRIRRISDLESVGLNCNAKDWVSVVSGGNGTVFSTEKFGFVL